MGLLKREFLEIPPEKSGNILLSFPGWAVEISPAPDPDRYWWHGPTQIVALRLTDREVEVDLELPDTTRIHTTFSRREIHHLPVSMETGIVVETGILRNQLHWLPLPGE